ncbi:PAAR-like domain-containing protein [uncultured Shewanella sp.]|uniref:PAAR-like domain-containing protein n=1 Tax=uncultured Shewanella sp. TaxID=173975 RepID=UPI002605B11B|nr:PAAR-like domain-containing protein [uncultured Shewanella sp.]
MTAAVLYPNISEGTMCDASTSTTTVLIDGGLSVTQISSITLSTGDSSGVLGGVASGQMMGSTSFTLGCTAVMVGGMPVQRLTSTTAPNGTSPKCVGVTLVSSQYKVRVLK